MVYFDTNLAPLSWYCQWRAGCILFALVNSGMISSRLFSWMTPNEDFSQKTTEDKIFFELKVMAIWALITGYYPFKHRETFHTIYSSFMKLVKFEKRKLSTSDYNKKLARFKEKIKTFETFFSQHDEKFLNNGTWNAGNHLRLQVEDFTTIDNLEYEDLVCEDGTHWIVYLGKSKFSDIAYFIDSSEPNKLETIAVSKLKNWKIIHRKNIFLDINYINSLISDFDDNPIKMLKNLRRREFSKKMSQLIKRLDMINFTEHDYNKYIKQSKSFLERLDKEHYKYEL